MYWRIVRAGGLGVTVLAGVCLAGVIVGGGCSTGSDRGGPLAKYGGRMPAILPAGVVGEREEGEFEAGPPPYGYFKIVGHAVPGWEPGGFDTRTSPLTWTLSGPKPVFNEYWSGGSDAAGRVVSIAPHPVDPNTCYIAAASGGVWKTTNGGALWLPLRDQLSILNSGAICLDPSNPDIIYYGTGDLRVGSNGDGLFRSVDAGATWVRIATAAQVGNQVTRIAVSPTDPNTIHVTGSSGYVRTTNGGTNWTNLLNGKCWGVVLNNTTPTTLLVARDSQGIYRSTNNGTTLTKLAGGLPALPYTRIELAISKSNPLVLYAAFINDFVDIGSNMIGLYRSADGGTTWIKKAATPNFCYFQCYYDAYVGVSPVNENIVFCGGVDPRYALAGIIKSTNGGDNWTEVSDGPASLPVHPDHHTIAWGPTGIIWEGSDGGVWKSSDGGSNWTSENSTLAITELYDVAIHPTATDRMLGGSQDNGSPERTGPNFFWPQLSPGDGGPCVMDSSTPTRRYTTYPILAITRWDLGVGTDITPPFGADRGFLTSPMVGDPNDSKVLLCGTQRVWRAPDADTAATWGTISGDLTGGDQNAALNAIAVATGSSDTIYTGASNGRVYVTINATAANPSWASRSTGLPTANVSDIIIAPFDPATAYVSNFGTTGGRIYRTTNYGVNWTNVTGTLPTGVAVTALQVDFAPRVPTMFAGTGSGVYTSFDGGATWTRNNSSLPNANITALKIARDARIIVAGTYGRSAWRATLPFCPADYNHDGFVDGIDYDLFNIDYESYDLLQQIHADYNGDGFVDGIDYDLFNADFEHGC